MRRSIVLSCALAFGFLSGVISCGDEAVPPECDPCPPPNEFRPLSTPDAVLNNLQVACNTRNLQEYDRLLDADFTFHAFAGDVAEGLPDQWGHTTDAIYGSRLLDPAYEGPNRCTHIDLDIPFEYGVQWDAFNPPSHPGEIWFSARLLYSFSIDVESGERYVPPAGAYADIAVRNVGTQSDPDFRLVEWTDGVLPNLPPHPPHPPSLTDATFGAVKGLYRDGAPAVIPLTTREAVLNNVEAAYNKRDITRYEALLDPEFTFYLSVGDIGNGLPEQWGYAEDVLYNSRMFDMSYIGPNRCTNIRFDLQFEEGVLWVSFAPSSHPDETWYTTTVFYDFQIDIVPDTRLLPPPGSRAYVTVRNAGTDADPHWRLVEMRDLGSQYIDAAAGDAPAAVQQSTWGRVKALYRS